MKSNCITCFAAVACLLSQSPAWHADLQWKLIYVGSAESEKFDQVLDDVEVGPVRRGKYKFVLQVCTCCAVSDRFNLLVVSWKRHIMFCSFVGGCTKARSHPEDRCCGCNSPAPHLLVPRFSASPTAFPGMVVSILTPDMPVYIRAVCSGIHPSWLLLPD